MSDCGRGLAQNVAKSVIEPLFSRSRPVLPMSGSVSHRRGRGGFPVVALRGHQSALLAGPTDVSTINRTAEMQKAQHYVLIAKGKDGELRGIGTIPVEVRGMMTVVLELVRPGYKNGPKVLGSVRRDRVRRPLREHLDAVIKRIIAVFSEGPRVFIDAHQMDVESSILENGTHPLTYVTEQLLSAGLRVGPVLSTGLSPRSQAAAAALVNERELKCCLRVQGTDFHDGDVLEEVRTFLTALEVRESSCELLLDFGGVPAESVGIAALAAEHMARAFAVSPHWAAITSAATGYVKWPTGTNDLVRLPRTELAIYEAAKRGAGRGIWYGDYGISGHLPPAPVKGVPETGVKLRYVSDADYLLFYGGKWQDESEEGFQRIARQLVQMPEFTKSLSWGDTYIEDASNGHGKGSPQMFVEIGTSHHIMFLLRELGFPYAFGQPPVPTLF